MFDRILVAVRSDDDSGRDAAALGADLASAYSADLCVSGIWVDCRGAGAAEQSWPLDRWMRETVDSATAGLPASLKLTKECLGAGSVNQGIRIMAQRFAADLLVLGPSHLGRVARALRGDVTLHALQDAPCAVVAAPPDYVHGPRLDGRGVMVAWDGSQEAGAALESAVDFARATGSTLRVVHVLEFPYRFTEDPEVDVEAHQHWLTSERPNALRLLEAGREAVAGRVPVETMLLEGTPGVEMARASRDAIAVFIGSRSLGTLSRVAVGSTSAQLLHRANVPVLVTPRSARIPDASAA